jgi:hypothetical protein
VEYIYTDKDGNQTKFTDEMVRIALDERDELRQKLNDCDDRASRYYSKLVTVREQVHEFFNSRFDPDTDTAIECEIDDVNELLRNVGAEELKKLWTVIGTINYTVSNISASNEDEANDYVMNELSVEVSGDADLDDWSIDISSTEQQ